MGLLLLLGNAGGRLLLDAISDAALAYSLRKLRTSYSGPAIRVRRTSDNAEQDIGFSGNALNTAAIESFCSGTDGRVATWYDQTGNNRNVTQGTTTAQPIIATTGVVATSNGLPAVDFVANNHFMQSASLSIAQPYSFFEVIEIETTAAQEFVHSTSTSGPSFISVNTNRHRIAAPTQLDSAVILTAARGQFSLLFSGASSVIRKNGASVASGNAGTATLDNLRIAAPGYAGQYFSGKMQELILFASDKSASNATIESEQKSYWGTP